MKLLHVKNKNLIWKLKLKFLTDEIYASNIISI